jgi:hypothetical protein
MATFTTLHHHPHVRVLTRPQVAARLFGHCQGVVFTRDVFGRVTGQRRCTRLARFVALVGYQPAFCGQHALGFLRQVGLLPGRTAA